MGVRLNGLLLLLLAVALTGCGQDPVADREAALSATRSRLAPEPRVVDLAGLQATLEEQRGRPYLLNFWATWCAPCIEEMPLVVAAVRAHPGLDLITVSYDLVIPEAPSPAEAVAALKGLQKSLDLPYPILVFQAEDYQAINAALGLPGPIPVTLAFDAAGEAVDRMETSGVREDFERLARAALSVTVE